MDVSKVAGAILYQGPSKIDGAPIVVITTGLKNASRNVKTGAMVQTYIIRADMEPTEAVKTGNDVSICGACVHRGNGINGTGRSCYVTLMHGPRAVYDGFKRGIYPKVNAFEARELFAGKIVRLGTYGDPAAAPFGLWSVATAKAAGLTGYTHQWRTIDARWPRLVMASVDTVADMEAAHALGYRTFRVTANAHENIEGLEVTCPASKEKGKVTNCLACKACMGTSSKAKVSIQIAAHGASKKYVAARLAA